MTEQERRTDIPKLVATAMTAAPALALRLGVTYLKLKRRSRKMSRAFQARLEKDGVPPDLARKLGEEYGSELSIRKFLDMEGGGLLRGLVQR